RVHRRECRLRLRGSGQLTHRYSHPHSLSLHSAVARLMKMNQSLKGVSGEKRAENLFNAPNLTFLLNSRREPAGLASEEALPLIYDELRQIAARQMAGESGHQTLQPTALVHEAWLRLQRGQSSAWNDRTHFFRVAVRTMRRILVDRARQRSCLKYA